MIVKFLLWFERRDVFEPMQIVVVPVLIFLACIVYGG